MSYMSVVLLVFHTEVIDYQEMKKDSWEHDLYRDQNLECIPANPQMLSFFDIKDAVEKPLILSVLYLVLCPS